MASPARPHSHDSAHSHADHPKAKPTRRLGVLAWPAWRRVLAVLPVVIALWLGMWWANMGALTW